MTSNRAKSPDRYIGITTNSQDHYLSKEEKRMLLNVYGVLRKEVRLSVKGAAARAADLCGVSISALFSAKKEFDKNCETKIPNRSLDPLGDDVSVQCNENNQFDTRNLPEPQPCNTGVYLVVKAKILELLGISGIATIESVVEAFQKDPHLPNLEESAIRHVVKQLNLTSYVSNVASEPVGVQQGKWDIPIEDGPTTPAAVSNDVTSPHLASGVRPEPSAGPDDDCCIVYCESDAEKTEDEAILPDSFEFHACSLTDVKTEAEEEVAGLKREVREEGFDPNPAGTFPGSAGNPFGDDVDSYGSLNADGVNSYESLDADGDQTLPFAGVLVYGLNAMNALDVTDSSAGVANGHVMSEALGGATGDTAGDGGDPIAPQWQPLLIKTGVRRPRDRRYRSCNACRRMFDRRGPLCQHLGGGRRRQQPPLVCRYCPRSFPGPCGKDFVQHTMYVHTMRSLACDYCDVSFDSAARLVRHVTGAHMDAFLEQQAVLPTGT